MPMANAPHRGQVQASNPPLGPYIAPIYDKGFDMNACFLSISRYLLSSALTKHIQMLAIPKN